MKLLIIVVFAATKYFAIQINTQGFQDQVNLDHFTDYNRVNVK